MQNLTLEASAILKDLTLRDKQNPAIQHALQIRRALIDNNYSRFFKLYRITPNMGAHLIQMFIHRIRVHALQVISKA